MYFDFERKLANAKSIENAALKQNIETLKQEYEGLRKRHNDLQRENAALRGFSRQGMVPDDASVRPPAYEDVFKEN